MDFRKIIDKLLTLKPVNACDEGKCLTFKLNTYTIHIGLSANDSTYILKYTANNIIDREIYYTDRKYIELTEVEYSEYLLKFAALYNDFEESMYNELLEAIKEQTPYFDQLLDSE